MLIGEINLEISSDDCYKAVCFDLSTVSCIYGAIDCLRISMVALFFLAAQIHRRRRCVCFCARVVLCKTVDWISRVFENLLPFLVPPHRVQRWTKVFPRKYKMLPCMKISIMAIWTTFRFVLISTQRTLTHQVLNALFPTLAMDLHHAPWNAGDCARSVAWPICFGDAAKCKWGCLQCLAGPNYVSSYSYKWRHSD